MPVSKLLNAASAPTAGPAVTVNLVTGAEQQRPQTFQATLLGTGTVSAGVTIEATNDSIGWVQIGVITLTGTALASDGFAMEASWDTVRARLTSITGTQAACTVTMGY